MLTPMSASASNDYGFDGDDDDANDDITQQKV